MAQKKNKHNKAEEPAEATKELAVGAQRRGTASGSAAVQRRANRARGQRSRTRQQTTTVAPTAGGVGVDLRGWYEVLI